MSEKESDAQKPKGPETSHPDTTQADEASKPESKDSTSEAPAAETPAAETKPDDSGLALEPMETGSANKADDADKTPEATVETPEPTAAAPAPAASGDDAEEEPEKKSRTPIWLILLVLINLVLIIALATGYWMDRRDQQANIQTAQSGLAVLDDRIGRAEGAITQNSDKSRRTASETAQFNKQVSRLKTQINHNTDLLAKLPGAERQDWLLAEAEYLMRLANQRLTLEKDWQGAVAMLLAADKVILETNNPRYDDVRAQLAKEILALRQVPAVDTVGAVNRLQALQDALEQLDWRPQRSMPELAEAVTDADEAARWFENLWEGVVEQIQRMIVIRFDQKVDIPVGPDQQYQLQYGMHLMLEQAQIAVLRRQQALYDRSLERVSGWLDNNLINDSASARAVRETLAELKGWNIDPQMPDVKNSLFLLREILEKQRRGVFDTPGAKAAAQKSQSKPAAKPAAPKAPAKAAAQPAEGAK